MEKEKESVLRVVVSVTNIKACTCFSKLIGATCIFIIPFSFLCKETNAFTIFNIPGLDEFTS